MWFQKVVLFTLPLFDEIRFLIRFTLQDGIGSGYEEANTKLIEILKTIKPTKADLIVFQKESNIALTQNEQDRKQK
jgi:hypothetical protein